MTASCLKLAHRGWPLMRVPPLPRRGYPLFLKIHHTHTHTHRHTHTHTHTQSASPRTNARRAGSIVPYTFVEGPESWTADDQHARESEWLHELSPQQVAELEAAVASAIEGGKIWRDESGKYLDVVRARRRAEGRGWLGRVDTTSA